MNSVSTLPVAQPAGQQQTTAHERVRVLRWSYRREGEQLECPASELFDDAVGAFERQASLEGSLIADGCHLDQFELGYL
jgi:hypothetical protein